MVLSYILVRYNFSTSLTVPNEMSRSSYHVFTETMLGSERCKDWVPTLTELVAELGRQTLNIYVHTRNTCFQHMRRANLVVKIRGVFQKEVIIKMQSEGWVGVSFGKRGWKKITCTEGKACMCKGPVAERPNVLKFWRPAWLEYRQWKVAWHRMWPRPHKTL